MPCPLRLLAKRAPMASKLGGPMLVKAYTHEAGYCFFDVQLTVTIIGIHQLFFESLQPYNRSYLQNLSQKKSNTFRIAVGYVLTKRQPRKFHSIGPKR